MTGPSKLLLFGDQTYDIQPRLGHLLKYRDNPVLRDFLSKAYHAVRGDMYKLPQETRERLPRFTCVDDLMLWDRRRASSSSSSSGCIPLDMAVTCIYQLGFFIVHASRDDYDHTESHSLGFCTGALAAAAVSCSRSAQDLVPLAVDAVVVAFRIGMRVAQVVARLSPPRTDRDEDSPWSWSWSIVVPKTTSCEAVERFRRHTALPPASRPYVSAYAPNGITVSGPPACLSQLVESEAFRGLTFKAIPVHGPYHAPHLYSAADVRDIVSDLPSLSMGRSRCIPLLSSTGPRKSSDDGFAALLEAAVGQILLEPIRWNVALGEIQASIKNGPLGIVPVGTTNDQLIYSMLKLAAPKGHGHDHHDQHLPPPPSEEVSDPNKPKLAIIGMSGRFPGAKDNEAFWDLLRRGLDVHKPVPALHWDAATHVDPAGARKNTSATPYGCWLDDPAVFDARFFNISPREAPQIDPAQRLALMTAYEAIEQAGLVPDATPSTRRDRVGVFYGVTSNDWMETNSAQGIDTYFIPGGNRAFIPGRINYCFKFSGPSYAVDTACSSSLAGIHLACNSLWRGDVDTAIAGGTNVLTNPDFTAGLDRGHFLSRTGNCKTFDDEADGYCRGEGIGTVIIKRLDDALADRDPILGLILGAYTNHSAESESITRPHVGAQRAIFRKILNQGAVDPYTVSYVEMHGTGTQAGDAGEMSSVLDTFAPSPSASKPARSSAQALYLGSAKANIGHGEAASGVSSLIKVLLMMQHSTIPPHCGIKTKINHRFPTDLRERHVNIALQPTPWERSPDPSQPRRVLVNNFSAAGGNSALLLEDAPLDQRPAAADARETHLVACSAKNGASLQGNLRSLRDFLKINPDVPLGQLSYTTTARRIHHQHRVMLAGSTAEDVCAQIEAALQSDQGVTRPKCAPRVVFAFTGQGAQYPGMGRQLLEHLSLFRSEIRQLDHLAQGMGFPSFLPVIQSDEAAGDVSASFSPVAVQLASVCLQIALARLWASWNVAPVAVVGHSLGEYAALNVAGVLSDADTVYLVGKRAQLLQERCTRDSHAMLVVRGSADDVAASVAKSHREVAEYETACLNSPVETVLAGPNERINAVKRRLEDAGLKCNLLKVPYAFHSSQVDPILDDFKKLASGVAFSKPRLPVICPLHGEVVAADEGGPFGAEYLADHSRQPVNMARALRTAQSRGMMTEQTAVLEIGPHPAVSGMVRANLASQVASLASLQRGRSAWHTIASSLRFLYAAGADIRWDEYQRDFAASHRVVRLPAYSWDLKSYWIQYVHDWSLRKGDPPLTSAAAADDAPGLESTTIHRVVEETTSPDRRTTRMVVEANIAREDLRPLVQGHEVDGIPLCTPSVYTDMALTLGRHFLNRHRPKDKKSHLVDVSGMDISKALILRPDASEQRPQLLQAHADVDWSSQTATIKFMSFDNKQSLQEHARCVVRFDGDRRLQQEQLQARAAGVRQKMQALRDGIAKGTTARFNRPMVYRAIRPLARFHDDYRAIDEVVLNSDTLEASSRISFASVKRGGRFHTHPAVIDALTQSCGFAMNCNDGSDLDVEVFMNHGWGSFQLFEPIDLDKDFTTYTRMTEGADRLWRGDVMVLEGEKVVASFGGIAIQGVPRRVLGVILSIESGRKAQRQQQPTASAATASRSPAAPTTRSIPAAASMTSKALSIIAEESGLSIADLTDGTIFADVGVDSLLGLTISARFREELDVDLDFNAFFFEYPTVGHLKALFEGPGTNSTATGVTTPQSTEAATGGTTTPGSDYSSADAKVDFSRVLQIISDESGVAVGDLGDDTNFADSGIDSLLSLVIVSRLRDELELDIQHESLLLECPTVADLKRLLLPAAGGSDKAPRGGVPASPPPPPPVVKKEDEAKAKAALAARKMAVDECVQRYTRGFRAPSSSPSSPSKSRRGDGQGAVVLVTGGTGSLGGHLVYHLAQLPQVERVVCVNRENKAEPYVRQQKAMRGKGIRFPDALKPKLLVLQTDSSKPKLGLGEEEWEHLASSVTHLIHNAWPMSAKRALAGFEAQFQVMRNLIDLMRDAASRRPADFKVSFQMVSSIGVVGNYGERMKKTRVPEDRMDIDSVLPNGYGEAKWGCERMLDETLHRHPDRFRAMAVRLGQIAGSKTSGYWNPMEHFGFLIKSSQTLNALPDVDGTVYWTPVNDVAATLCDLVLSGRDPYPVYHVENPVGQSWREMNAVLADALGIPNLIPFEEWVERVRKAPQRDNPASTLLEFLDSNYLRMSCGELVLDVKKTLEHSETLSRVGPVSDEVVRKYVHIWKEIGFLQ